MNVEYYSPKTIEKYIKDTLCQGDPVTYKHYKNNNIKLFRKRLKDPKLVEQVVYVCCTNILRDSILDVIGKITGHMRPWGDLIVTGGEAFNNYFDYEDRVISSDIDTKFVPTFMSPFQKKFFGYLQYCKLYLWKYLGQMARACNEKFMNRVKMLSRTKVGKLLGIRVHTGGPCVKRRYTLIKKSPRDKVLIDVELFALDLELRYYSPSDKKISDRTLGGILDIAMMRPFEVGYEIAFTRERGIYYKNVLTGKNIYNKNILIAGKHFLIEDLFLMKSLGLRPTKAKKDKKRMINFAKKILKIKNISSKTSDEKIFEKTMKVLGPKKNKVRRSVMPKNIMKQNLNPFNGNKHTAATKMSTLKKLYRPGIKTKHYKHIKGFEKTDGRKYFDTKSRSWKQSKNPYYVRNMYNFRPENSNAVNIKPMKPENILYGRNKNRNNWIPKKILKQSAMIPFVGLKNKNIKKLVK